MKFLIILLILGLTLPAYSQGQLASHCTNLESSTMSDRLYERDIAISDDRSLVAGSDDKAGKFYLWNAETGKLLKTKHYADLRSTTLSSLNISPSGRFIYYTNLERPKEYKAVHHQTIFWNTDKDTISPLDCGDCSTNIRELSLNNDETIAYIKSGGFRNHYHHGLCSTIEQKALVCEHTEGFDQQMPPEAFKYGFLNYKEPESPLPKATSTEKTAAGSKYHIPGGYLKDKDYQEKHSVHKFDQYLVTVAKDEYRYQGGLLLVFNWKTKEGTLLNVEGSLEDNFSPIRLGDQHLIFSFKDYGRKPMQILEVYDFHNKTLARLSGEDEVIYIQQASTSRSVSSLAYVTQTQDYKRLKYCTVQQP